MIVESDLQYPPAEMYHFSEADRLSFGYVDKDLTR
jgi:hypothetical protein